EGALSEPEQLRFEELGGHGRTVHGQERLCWAGGPDEGSAHPAHPAPPPLPPSINTVVSRSTMDCASAKTSRMLWLWATIRSKLNCSWFRRTRAPLARRSS